MFNFYKKYKTVQSRKLRCAMIFAVSSNLHAIFADIEKIHICGSNACKYHGLFQ